MGAEIGRGSILLEMDDKGAISGLNNASKAVDDLTKSADGASGSGSSITSMLSDWRVQAAGFLVVARQAAGVAKEMYLQGVTLRDVADAYRVLGGDIDATMQASNGLLSALDAMRLENKAHMVGLTSDQFHVLARFADYASDAVGAGLVPTLEQLIQGLATGRTQALKQFGIDVETGGTKAETAADAIAKMTEKLDGLPAGFQAANDASIRLGASWDTLYAAMGANISKITGLDEAMNAASSVMLWLAKNTDLVQGAMSGLLQAVTSLVGGGALGSLVRLGQQARDAWAWATGGDDVFTFVAPQFDTLQETFDYFGGEQSVMVKNALAVVTLETMEFEASVQRATKAVSNFQTTVATGGIGMMFQPAITEMLSYVENLNATLTTQEAVAQRQREIDYENAYLQVEIDAWKNQTLYAQQVQANQAAEQQASQHTQFMLSVQQMFANVFAGSWTAMWQEIAAGSGFQTILKMFLDMIGNMAIQLGTMIMLSALAFQAVPIFGWLAGGAGVAAGLALQAFGGIVKGLASTMGSGSKASGGRTYGSGYSGNSTTAPVVGSNEADRTIIINISGGLSTSDDIAAAVMSAMRHGESMGY